MKNFRKFILFIVSIFMIFCSSNNITYAAGSGASCAPLKYCQAIFVGNKYSGKSKLWSLITGEPYKEGSSRTI